MKVYQRLAANFKAEGLTHMFGIMGDGNMYWMHELDKLGGVARAFGGKGRQVRNPEEMRAAVAEWVAKPDPMVIDARISRSVITLPYRRIHYGQDE
jgi:thiamine pyrophosphate-dependent acetolactate synthase large subunit-like protein